MPLIFPTVQISHALNKDPLGAQHQAWQGFRTLCSNWLSSCLVPDPG